jgi:hypothetical protein
MHIGCLNSCGYYSTADLTREDHCSEWAEHPTPELLPNGGFETGLDGWRVFPIQESLAAVGRDPHRFAPRVSRGEGRGGSNGLVLTLQRGVMVLGSASREASNRPCVGNVVATAWAATTSGATARLSVGCNNETVEYLDRREVYGNLMNEASPTLGPSSGWTQLTAQGRVPTMCESIGVILNADGDGRVTFDDVSLKGVSR